jgi:ribosome-binding protein aMBF1 (putative translation factor)
VLDRAGLSVWSMRFARDELCHVVRDEPSAARRFEGPVNNVVDLLYRLRLEVGTRIRKARQALGMSQEALAERAGLHRNYVGSIERGEREVGISRLASLIGALGLSLAEFFAPFRPSARFKR